jgi:hypothetical protein
MFLLKSTTSKPPSREFTAEECTEIENMEYVYVAEKEKPRTRERRGSRLRASLFGGRRKSVDVPTTTESSDDGLNSPSQSAFDDEGASIHSRRRRTLRKMTSKSSLNSVSTASEGSQESKTKSLFSTQTLFRSPSQSQLCTRAPFAMRIAECADDVRSTTAAAEAQHQRSVQFRPSHPDELRRCIAFTDNSGHGR